MIFCGSGMTGAINKLVDVLNLRIPADLDDRYALRVAHPARRATGRLHRALRAPQQRAAVARVDRRRRHDRRGRRRAHRPRRISSARSSSTRTGRSGSAPSRRPRTSPVSSDTRAISVLLHRHGALSFWDFAAAGPYVEIEMDAAPAGTATPTPLDHKDAIVLSPHKFIGGPGTPGVLVARRELFRNRVPTVAGRRHGRVREPARARVPRRSRASRGGRHPGHRRVDPGRPRLPGQGARRQRRDPRARGGLHPRAMAAWSAQPGIGILGNQALPRLSIVSFTVRHDGRYLHHNFVVALLNDLFGIQSRGGCSCAGPYGHRLLGIDIETSHAFEREISRGCEGIKPGWVRVNFNYFISEAVFDFIVAGGRARRPATAGGSLPWYRFEPTTGLWRHAAGSPEPPLSLHDIHFDDRRAPLPGASPPRARVASGRPPGGGRADPRRPGRRPRPAARRRTALGRRRLRVAPLVLAPGGDRRAASVAAPGQERIPVSSGGRAAARGRTWPCRRRP